MKAIVLYGKEDVRLTDFKVAELKPGDVKVAVSYCGICGSDFHKYEGKKNTHPIHYPVPLGHEVSGYVVDIGSEVTGFQVGDRVTVDPNWSCGKCAACQRGQTQFCENARGVVKGMAQYVVAPAENVYRLPEGLDMRTAALAEPVSCCLHGMDLLDVRQGENVALVGFGAIGCIILQMLRQTGAAQIVVVESNEEKREAALRMGATKFISAMDQAALEAVAKEINIDKVMECVGVSAAQHTALTIAGHGATVVLFGVSDEKDALSLSVYDAFLKELTIKTSFVNPHTMQRAIALLASGALTAEDIISREIGMEDVQRELETREFSRKGKVIVRVDEHLA